jgi:AbiV family abortive infection protein
MTITQKIESFIDKLLKNSKEIYNSSRLLFDNKNYNTSFFLIVIALEELGKVVFATSHQTHSLINTMDEKRFFKCINNHEDKLEVLFQLGGFIALDNLDFKDIESFAKTLHKVKLESLYVNFKSYNTSINKPTEEICSAALELHEKFYKFLISNHEKFKKENYHIKDKELIKELLLISKKRKTTANNG